MPAPTPAQAAALRAMPNLRVLRRAPNGDLIVLGAERKTYALDRGGLLRPTRGGER